MDSDLLRRLRIRGQMRVGRTPAEAEVNAAVELVHRLLGPGGSIHADGSRFAVRTVSFGRGHNGAEEADLLFWARERPSARAVGIKLDWWPAEWPRQRYGGRPSWIELTGTQTVPWPIVTLWKLRGEQIAPSDLSSLEYHEPSLELARLRVHSSAYTIVDFLVQNDVQRLQAWHDALATAPLAAVRAAAARIEVSGPPITPRTPFTRMGDVIDTWRTRTVAGAEATFIEAASQLAPVVRAAMSDPLNPAAYETALRLGYDLIGWDAEYVRATNGRGGRDRIVRPVTLLSRRGADGEAPRALEVPETRREGLDLQGDWSVSAADAMALVRDSAAITREMTPPAQRALGS